MMITLVVILGVEVLFVLLATIISAARCQIIPVGDLKEVMLIVFGPTVALVGSAAGFYFSTRGGQH